MLVVIFWYIALTYDQMKRRRHKNLNQYQLDDIARIRGNLPGHTCGDHLGEPLVEAEVLARHGPDQVHAVLLRHVVDVAKAGVVLKIQNGLNQTSSTSLEKAFFILIRVLI